jgi:hypothetical protein
MENVAQAIAKIGNVIASEVIGGVLYTLGSDRIVRVIDADVLELVHHNRYTTQERAAAEYREAIAAAVRAEDLAGRPCAFCGTLCSTHQDAAHPLAPCGDCGAVTCSDHRVVDEADRCVACAARHHGSAR